MLAPSLIVAPLLGLCNVGGEGGTGLRLNVFCKWHPHRGIDLVVTRPTVRSIYTSIITSECPSQRQMV